MALHGTRFIVAEFAIGMVLPLILGVIAIRSGQEILVGLWLIGVAINYVPLFLYAILIARSGTVKEEGQPELAHVKRYSVQQFLIFIPFLILVLAILQEGSRRVK